MTTKKNLPNIPIYIGDWERDCNVLSLESEAAWMRIVFKLWTKGRQSSIKMPTKSLQNLWRCDQKKIEEILEDFKLNDICEVNEDGPFVTFTCRRFVKENEISEIRSKAAKGSKKETKRYQKSNKREQNTENENENENENEKIHNGEIENLDTFVLTSTNIENVYRNLKHPEDVEIKRVIYERMISTLLNEDPEYHEKGISKVHARCRKFLSNYEHDKFKVKSKFGKKDNVKKLSRAEKYSHVR